MNELTEDQKVLVAKIEFEHQEKLRKLHKQAKGTFFDKSFPSFSLPMVMLLAAYAIGLSFKLGAEMMRLIMIMCVGSVFEGQIDRVNRRLNAFVELQRLQEEERANSLKA